MLDKFVDLGLEAVEVSVGGFVGNSHCNSAQLSEDDAALNAFKDEFEKRDLPP